METEEKEIVENNSMAQSENPLDQSESAVDKSEITKCFSANSGKKRKLTKEEREQKNQEREVKRMAIQKEKNEKAEKAEKKRLEKERLQKQRDEEKERKEKKRLEDEEAKRKKDEELKRKRLEQEEEKERKRREEEEAKRKRDEEIERLEMKKKRMSQSFINFFQKIGKTEPPPTLPMPANSRFKPFEIKEGMTLAPIHRRPLLSADEYHSLLQAQLSEPTNYLLKVSKKERKSTNDLPDVIPINPLKAKLFQFHDNYRHPYYGTWRKMSKFVTGRRPFSTSDKTMDYEYDSDQDWEDDPSEGDECKSDEEDNEKEEADDEEDEGFFVGHGYLSAGEGSEEEDENLPSRHAKETDEQRRQRLAHTDQEWKEAQKQKKQKTKGPKKLRLNPTIYGPSWTDPDKDEHSAILQHLMAGVIFDYASLNTQKS